VKDYEPLHHRIQENENDYYSASRDNSTEGVSMTTINPEKHDVSGRDNQGRYKPGTSGNPAGRPPSLPAELRKQLEDGSPEIILTVIEAARNGDMTAARLVLERIAPVSRPTAPLLKVSELEKADRLADKSQAVVDAVARGECPADIGATLIQALAACARIIEVDELERRISALEVNG
jgi:hypothetical protein